MSFLRIHLLSRYLYRMPVLALQNLQNANPGTTSEGRSKACLGDAKVMTMTQCISWMRFLLRVCTLCSLLRSVMAKEDQGHVKDEAGAGGTLGEWAKPLWNICGPSVIALEFVVGFILWFTGCSERFFRIGFVHGPMQLLPLIVYFRQGWVNCGTGLWWPVHWVYVLVLQLSMSVLTQSINGTMSHAEVPFFGWKGTPVAKLYLYSTTVLNASDQYLDCMTAAIALQCGWSLAWAMVTVIFVSAALQALAAAKLAGKGGDIAALVGISPEASAASPNGVFPGRENKGGQPTDGKKFAAAQGVAKLVTENIPQAYLAVKFSNEVKPSKMVYFSAAMSLTLAMKTFVSSLMYFLGEKTAEPAVE